MLFMDYDFYFFQLNGTKYFPPDCDPIVNDCDIEEVILVWFYIDLFSHKVSGC